MKMKYLAFALAVALCLMLGGCFGGDAEQSSVVLVTEPSVAGSTEGESSSATPETSESSSASEAAEKTSSSLKQDNAQDDSDDADDVYEGGFYEDGVFYQYAKPSEEKLVHSDVRAEVEEIGVKVMLNGYVQENQVRSMTNSIGAFIEKDGKLWAAVYSEGMYVLPIGNISYTYPEKTDNYVYITHQKDSSGEGYEWKLWAIPMREKKARAVFLGDLTGIYDFTNIWSSNYIIDGNHGYYQRLIATHNPKGGDEDEEDEEVSLIIYSDFVKGASEFEVLEKNVPKAADGKGYLDFDIVDKKKIKLLGEADEGSAATEVATEAATTAGSIGADLDSAGGFYRLWGEEGTASAEIDASGVYTAYYASGAAEFVGKIEHVEGYVYALYVEETGAVYTIEFDSDWSGFVMGDLEFKRAKSAE